MYNAGVLPLQGAHHASKCSRTGQLAKRSDPDRLRRLELRFRGAPARTGRIRRNTRGNRSAGETDAARRPSPAWSAFEGTDISHLPPFDHSGIHDPGLEPFPPSRPAVTDLAKEKGEALGIKVKPTGNRRLQPDRRRILLLAPRQRSRNQPRVLLVGEPDADQPAAAPGKNGAVLARPFRRPTKPRFATTARLLGQLELFQKQGTGNFRDLTVAVAQDPAMLSFLDAGVNVKGASNENFAREIMEIFTMGVGHYTEKDIREAARAFTGWNYVDLKFVVNKDQHDDGEKTFLGQTGRLDGVDVIDIIMQQPATADYIAGKIYRYFVRAGSLARAAEETGRGAARQQLRDRLRCSKPSSCRAISTVLRRWARRSRARYSSRVDTYKKLGLKNIPGVPDFNLATAALGQQLFSPPTVAGWAGGRSWITPGLLLERGNFARDILFPDISFLPPDRVHRRWRGSQGRRDASGREWTSPPRPWMTPRAATVPSRTRMPIATRTSTRATAVSAARRWPSSESSRFRATRRRSICRRWC